MTQSTARIATLHRQTAETEVELTLALDGKGVGGINSGIPFLDHMLRLFAQHGLFDLTVRATGDLDVDYHHTVEDVGILLGRALKQALGQKEGIQRYGFFLLPMDEVLARIVIDLSQRPLLVYQVQDHGLRIRDFNLSLVREFFQAFTNEAGVNLHMTIEYGVEPHHMAEALFKGFGRALDQATRLDPRLAGQIPSTKGVL